VEASIEEKVKSERVEWDLKPETGKIKVWSEREEWKEEFEI
jgi:hypothetical protein